MKAKSRRGKTRKQRMGRWRKTRGGKKEEDTKEER